MPYWDYYEPSRPREAKGGIKSQSKRGSFGESWWAKRWQQVLESYGLGARLTRGRSYARSGQVLSIDIEAGLVRAKVQGSRVQPYKVTMKVKPFSADEWDRAIAALAEQPLFAAKLLSGEMPAEIEKVFQDVRLSLFPAKMNDLTTDCSCPDWSNPCKHTAAVYYLLGEEFDRDPFLLFTLRGMTREELGTRLIGAEADEASDVQPSAPPEPLAVELTAFWGGLALEESLWDDVSPPPVSAALVRRLGKFPFWRGSLTLLEETEPIYARASAEGLKAFLGDSS